MPDARTASGGILRVFQGDRTLRRSAIEKTERFGVSGTAHVLSMPIEEFHTPGLELHVQLVGQAPRVNADGELDPSLPPRPAAVL
ncbi:MAG: hypothetical protein OEZ06_30965 [Myxococcales bacterium]|nr:hypothetical protein [Myxococcales bacterium]